MRRGSVEAVWLSVFLVRKLTRAPPKRPGEDKLLYENSDFTNEKASEDDKEEGQEDKKVLLGIDFIHFDKSNHGVVDDH